MKKIICIFCFLMLVPTISFARNEVFFSLNIPIIQERYHRHKCYREREPQTIIIINESNHYNRRYVDHLRRHNHRNFRNDVIIINK